MREIAAASWMRSLLGRLLRYLGNIWERRENSGIALWCFREAAILNPLDAKAAYAQAKILRADGRLEPAEAALLQAVSAEPAYAEALNLLGVIRLEQGDNAAAERYFEQAMLAKPAYAAAHNNLGNIYLERGELSRAENAYRKALAVNPGYVESLNNLALVLGRQGKPQEAERLCRDAIAKKPGFAGAHSNLGTLLYQQGNLSEAVACYRQALSLEPLLPEALVNMAIATGEPVYLGGALDYYRKLLQRTPDSYTAHIYLGQAYQALSQWDAALERYQAARDLQPDNSSPPAMLAGVYSHNGDWETAQNLRRESLALQENIGIRSGYVFNLLYSDAIATADILQEHRRWAEIYADCLYPAILYYSNDTSPGRRLRVGYVSKDFGRHSVAYFIEPVICEHDRAQFEVYCYSNLLNGDDYTERFRGAADVWRDVSLMSNAELCGQIQRDAIDILVDLSGHTGGNRLLVMAEKPAPVQATYLGYAFSTGLKAIDYRLTDAVADPAGAADRHSVEKLVRLPGCFLTYQPPADAPDVSRAPCLGKGYVTFGSFNNAIKCGETVAAVWAEILTAVPHSRLLLKSNAFGERRGIEHFQAMFARHGIEPGRIDLVAWNSSLAEHLSQYGEIDIALDPFPYNGTTTSCEALWMGVPVVALAGERHSGRVGASLLACVGLPELVAASVAEYVAVAVNLAGRPDRIQQYRATIRGQMRQSPLLDGKSFTRGLEDAYRKMWEAWCETRQKPPQP